IRQDQSHFAHSPLIRMALWYPYCGCRVPDHMPTPDNPWSDDEPPAEPSGLRMIVWLAVLALLGVGVWWLSSLFPGQLNSDWEQANLIWLMTLLAVISASVVFERRWKLLHRGRSQWRARALPDRYRCERYGAQSRGCREPWDRCPRARFLARVQHSERIGEGGAVYARL